MIINKLRNLTLQKSETSRHYACGETSPVNLGHQDGSILIPGLSKLNEPRVGGANIVDDLRLPMDNDVFIWPDVMWYLCIVPKSTYLSP